MYTIVNINSTTWCLWCRLWTPSIYSAIWFGNVEKSPLNLKKKTM